MGSMPSIESEMSGPDSGILPGSSGAESTDLPVVPESPDAVASYRVRNFFSLMFYQVTVRCGWIFKTESIVMPAVLDLMGGGALLRSWLPLINRCGQSIPPLLMASRVRSLGRKKWFALACTASMAVIFGGLACIWFQTNGRSAWVPMAFLILYALFFCSTGLNHLAINTLQGKLIRTRVRGRLLMGANVVGGCLALVMAGWLLPRWLQNGQAQFGCIFMASAVFFGLATWFLFILRESADSVPFERRNLSDVVGDVLRTLQEDQHFRGLAAVAFLFGCSMMLFPELWSLISWLGTYKDTKSGLNRGGRRFREEVSLGTYLLQGLE